MPVTITSLPNSSNLDVALSTRATGAILNPHPVSLSSIPNPSNLDVLLSTRLKISDFVLAQELGKIGIILTTGGPIIDPRQDFYSNGIERNALPSATFGKYVGGTGTITVLATAQSGTTGDAYFWNPVGSGKVIRIKRLSFISSAVTAAAFVSAPRIIILRITLTGTGTGTQIVFSKLDSTCPASIAYFSLASTGATLTSVGMMVTFRVQAVLTAVGTSNHPQQIWQPPQEDDVIVLRAGEGIIIQQPDAGTTSDTRVFNIDIAWDESTT